MKIYVASSWRNEERQQQVVKILRDLGHEVYDFRNPPADEVTGFHWREIDENWENWTAEQGAEALKHPVVQENYNVDRRHLDWCEACVLVLPSGKSAHLEAGYCCGAGKTLVTFLSDGDPELMHLMSDWVITGFDELVGLFAGNCWQRPEAWLEETFMYGDCAECNLGAEDHDAVPVMNNWFARCQSESED